MSTTATTHGWVDGACALCGKVEDAPRESTTEPCPAIEAPEWLSITEQKSSVRWEYGVQRDEATAMGTRARAEQEIERQRSRKGGFRITNQRLVRRLVSEWEEVTS